MPDSHAGGRRQWVTVGVPGKMCCHADSLTAIRSFHCFFGAFSGHRQPSRRSAHKSCFSKWQSSIRQTCPNHRRWTPGQCILHPHSSCADNCVDNFGRYSIHKHCLPHGLMIHTVKGSQKLTKIATNFCLLMIRSSRTWRRQKIWSAHPQNPACCSIVRLSQ